MNNTPTQPEHTQGRIMANGYHLQKEGNEGMPTGYPIGQSFVMATGIEPGNKPKPDSEGLGNAQRLAACWNAFEGVPTDQVSPSLLAEVRELREEKAALWRSLAIMTDLCRLKYGNLDREVYAEIEKAEEIIAKHKPA